MNPHLIFQRDLDFGAVSEASQNMIRVLLKKDVRIPNSLPILSNVPAIEQ